MNTYDIDEAADILKADRTTVLDLIDAGEITAGKFGRGWCIPAPLLDEYIIKRALAQTAERKARAEEASSQTRARNRNRSEASIHGKRTRRRRPYPTLPDLP